jgi:hypothetical protein
MPKRHPEEAREIAMVDANNFPVMTHHIEVMTIYRDGGRDYGPGIGIEFPTPTDKNAKKWLDTMLEQTPGPIYLTPEGKYVAYARPMYHTVDEIFLFIGTDPEDPTDLGGEVEFWMGRGEDAEKHVITKTSVVFVPKGLVHGPIVFKNVRRPFKEIVIFTGPVLVEYGIEDWPPDYVPPKPPKDLPIVDTKRTKLITKHIPK